MRLLRGLPSLRTREVMEVQWKCFRRGSERADFAVCEFSIQRDHLHLIVEACGREVLSRSMQDLAVRIARTLNRLWSRRGALFGDRYHDRVPGSPCEVRNALVYVLQNGHKHESHNLPTALDPFSSALWLDGWKDLAGAGTPPPPRTERPTPTPRSWRLTGGWKRARPGRLSIHERPGSRAKQPRRREPESIQVRAARGSQFGLRNTQNISSTTSTSIPRSSAKALTAFTTPGQN